MLTQLSELLGPLLFQFGFSFAESLMLQFVVFTTYLIFSFPAAKFIDKFGYKNGVISGLIFASCGSILLVNSIQLYDYFLILVSLIFIGTGKSFLQISVNGYVVLTSKAKLGASNLTFSQAINSFGRLLVALFAFNFVYWLINFSPENLSTLSPDEYRAIQIELIKYPYSIMVVILVITGVLFYFCNLPELKTKSLPIMVKGASQKNTNILYVKHLLLASLAIFVYVGAEVSIAGNIKNYVENTQILGSEVEPISAGLMLEYFLGSMLVGRIIGGYILRDLSPRKVLAGFAGGAVLFILISIFTTGKLAIISIVAVGFFNSIMFPCIFTLGINGLGHYAEEGASVLIASIVGGAIIPLLVISVADIYGIKLSFLIPVFCYLYIMYFGLSGSKFIKKETELT